MKPKKWRFTIDIELEEIYEALREREMSTSVANVKKLCSYLETTARDAASNALVDFAQNEVSLNEKGQARS